MKRVGNLYPKIYDKDNIRRAIYRTSEHKRKHKHVKVVLDDIEHYVDKTHELLIHKAYVPSSPKPKEIQDNSSGKQREIFKPNFFPDQIIHWALMIQLEPIIMKGMYPYSCGSVRGRGTTYGQKTIRKWLDSDVPNTKYCLKMDVKKFYPSIDNEVLKGMFRKKLKDADCLWLIDTIIDGNQGQPIGFYTSQWFSNFFLEGLDHYIKEELHIKYYVRYVDDLVMFGNNKKKLRQARKDITAYLHDIKLDVKDDWQVFHVDKRPVDFLGIRFYRHKSTLRRRNALRIRRRMKKIGSKDRLTVYDAQAVISYWGWIKRTDSYGFYHKYVKPNVSISDAKKVVSEHARAEALRQREVGRHG